LHSKIYCLVFLTLFREGLGEAYDGDIAFASAIENFGGGHNDPHFVALGGKPCVSFPSHLPCLPNEN